MDDLFDRYESGPDATVRAAADATARLARARSVVLVEGVSDQIAVEAAARSMGVDLGAVGCLVLPIGGAQAVGRTVRDLRLDQLDLAVVGLCDERERRWFEDVLEPGSAFVCICDLEDELLRAAGRELVERTVTCEGDADAFATMRAQPHWRDRSFDDQFRRFVAAGARRKHRYASALVDALTPGRLPEPLRGAVDAAAGRRPGTVRDR